MLHPDPVHETIARRGPTALAWEVLRRDPAYRATYLRVLSSLNRGVAADDMFVADWGLHFR